jgi:simple sugar transport system permease protein
VSALVATRPRFGQFARSHTSELSVFAAVFIVGAVVAVFNPAFLGAANLFDLARLVTVNSIFAVGVLIVLVSGGVDVSFPAIANVSAYAVAALVARTGLELSVPAFFALAVPLGILFGLLNGFLVGRFRLPTLIVTLGTSSVLYGATLYFVGGLSIFDLPSALQDFSRASIATVNNGGLGTTSLQPVVLIAAVLPVLAWLFLNYTASGRKIYALGGNPAVLERSGVNVLRLQLLIYGIVGGLASVAGVIDVILSRNANPVSLQGGELVVIAAVVLGGASITGGRGTVLGALAGIILLGIIENSLVLVGIPTVWQQVAVGAVLIIGVTIPALRATTTMGKIR